MKYIIFPNNMGSHSAKSLAGLFKTKMVYPNKRYIPKPGHIILNWGNASYPAWYNRVLTNNSVLLNDPTCVLNSSNKIRTLELFKSANIKTVDYFLSKEEAKLKLNEGKWIVARTVINGSNGNGIVLVKSKDEHLPDAKLYTVYKRKKNEYRVHVFNNKVIDFSIKRRKLDHETNELFNKYIRTHDNGWIFCRENAELNDDIKMLAVNAINVLGLDFGAVDIGETKKGEPFIIEVNSAPGIEGTTLDRYKEALNDFRQSFFIP